MPDTKISALPPAAPLAGTEVFPAVQTGFDVGVTATQIAAFAGGGGGGPTWTTPPGGALKWQNVALNRFINFNDVPGVYQMTVEQGSAFVFMNGPGLVAVMGVTLVAYAINVQPPTNYAVTIIGGGNVTMNGALNTLNENGFAGTFRQWVSAFPGNWGGPGVPPDLETAMDRVANALAVLIGGPIP
jgi:hypothetical protein